MLAAVQYQADHFEDAPVIVVACLHGRSGPTADGPGRVSTARSSRRCRTCCWRPASIGLGATLTTLPLWSRTQARRTLQLPAKVTPCAVIPLGWPLRGGYGPNTRRPVREILHLDHYGNRAFLRSGGRSGRRSGRLVTKCSARPSPDAR